MTYEYWEKCIDYSEPIFVGPSEQAWMLLYTLSGYVWLKMLKKS